MHMQHSTAQIATYPLICFYPSPSTPHHADLDSRSVRSDSPPPALRQGRGTQTPEHNLSSIVVHVHPRQSTAVPRFFAHPAHSTGVKQPPLALHARRLPPIHHHPLQRQVQFLAAPSRRLLLCCYRASPASRWAW
jgi:hypothetical protein